MTKIGTLKISAGDKRLNEIYGGIQGLYWLMAAVCLGFMTPILQDRGFTSSQIGILIAVRCSAIIVSQIFISNIADFFADRIPLKFFAAAMTVIGILTNMSL